MAVNALRTTQDSPVSVHEDTALHTVPVSLFADAVIHKET